MNHKKIHKTKYASFSGFGRPYYVEGNKTEPLLRRSAIVNKAEPDGGQHVKQKKEELISNPKSL